MTKSEILDDLAYVKSMAEEGRNAPLLGGRISLWWGTLLCATLLTHWFIMTGRASMGETVLGFLWMSFGVIGALGSAVLGKTLRSKPGVSSANNRVMASLWTANTYFLLSFSFAAGVSAALGFNDFDIMNIIMPVAFGLYGLSYYVAAKIGGERWMFYPSLTAFIIMAVSLFILSSPDLFLVSIIGVIATIIIPGIVHLRREPSDVV